METEKQEKTKTTEPSQAEFDPITNPLKKPPESIDLITVPKELEQSAKPAGFGHSFLMAIVWSFIIFIASSAIAINVTGVNSCSGPYCGLGLLFILPICFFISVILGTIIGVLSGANKNKGQSHNSDKKTSTVANTLNIFAISLLLLIGVPILLFIFLSLASS